MWVELASLEFNGKAVDPVSLEKLNYWLSADGAWRCTLLPHFESERVLSQILRNGGAVRIGPAGAGRFAPGTAVEKVLGHRQE
jgi:hypothetical protein